LIAENKKVGGRTAEYLIGNGKILYKKEVRIELEDATVEYLIAT
jgi:hypothetical protein